MKARRWLIACLSAVMVCGLGAAIAACTNGSGTTTGEGEHTHAYTKYEHSETQHWKVCPSDSAEDPAGKSDHTFTRGVCTTCGYVHEDADHTFEDGVCTVCGLVHESHMFADGVCTVCGFEHTDHVYAAYTQTEDGHARECAICHEEESGEHTFENGVCTTCGYAHTDHTWDGASCTVCGLQYRYGTLYFGEYPQQEVDDDNDSDQSLRNALNMDAGVPSAGNAGKWTSYGYYISGAVSEFMWYIDVDYEGNRYRGVYFASYRPNVTTSSSSETATVQDDYGYQTNTAYWFKYEPIEWRILEQKDGNALLLANIVLDSVSVYHDLNDRTGDTTVSPNNYAESDIRTWLNNTFLNTAFDADAKKLIATTNVHNDASTTKTEDNPYACADTEDRVFLLSYADVMNEKYGFIADKLMDDAARQFKATDYAKCQGVNRNTSSGFSWWWLRTPNYGATSRTNGQNIVEVSDWGMLNLSDGVTRTDGGVVPALWIKL